MPQITLYLVRHGEADSNALGLVSSYPEAPENARHLTERGIEQIRKVGKLLEQEKVDIILASPLTRTRETATLIAEATGAEILYDIRLRETDFGAYNGLPVDQFLTKYPDPRGRIDTDGGDGVESFRSMQERAEHFLSDVRARYAGKTVVLVSHGDTLEQLRGVIEGNDLETTAVGWTPEKGSCTKFVWEWTD